MLSPMQECGEARVLACVKASKLGQQIAASLCESERQNKDYMASKKQFFEGRVGVERNERSIANARGGSVKEGGLMNCFGQFSKR